MLRSRVVTAAAVILLLIAICLLDFHVNGGRPGIWLVPLGAIASVMSTTELLRMFRTLNLRPSLVEAHVGTLLVFLTSAVHALWSHTLDESPIARFGWPFVAFASAIVLVWIGEIRRFEKPGNALVNIAVTILLIAYVGVFMSFLVALRTFESNEWGMIALLSLIVVVKSSDVGAYTVGRLWGRHKLAPTVSPGKTVEGVVGGTVSACLASWLMLSVIPPLIVTGTGTSNSWGSWLAYGLLISTAGIVGDLCESLIKRDTGQKDSGAWLPGFGGMLDLIDSLLFAAPVAYVCWATGIVGP